jgi:hypothetical protein
MQKILQRMSDRDQLKLDTRTVDRLLEGTMLFDDAPPRYQRVALALGALREPATEVEMAGQEAAVASIAAMVEYRATATARKPTPAVRRPFRLVTASLVGGLTLFGGLAAANALPGSVQGVASDVLDQVGVSVPAPSSNAGDHPADVRGESGSNVTVSQGSDDATGASGHTKPSTGAGVSNAGGNGNGATISADASNGKSHAGQQNSQGANSSSNGNGRPVDPGNSGNHGKPDATGKPDKVKDNGPPEGTP